MAVTETSTFQKRKKNPQKNGKMTDSQPPLNTKSKTVSSAGRNKQLTIQSYLIGALIISIVLSTVAVFRNTLTWHFQTFWDASGDFWQMQWDKVLDYFGEDPFNFWVYGSVLLSSILYWVVGGIYTILDVTNKPAALRRYKIQPGTNEPVDTKRLLKVIMVVLINQTVVSVSVGYLNFMVVKWRGCPPVRELPTFQRMLTDIVVFILVEEIGFYYAHRLLHHRFLYRFIHKRHHEWTAPIAVTAIYCHPIEHIFSNLVPLFLGIFLMGSHVATAYIWFTLGILNTLNEHCGYHFPFFPSPEAHDFHHFKFNQCYGVLGILDRLHGTDKIFRSTPAYARHRMIQGLIPAREIFAG